MVIAYDIGMISQQVCMWQLSPDGFRGQIAQLPSADEHLTIWLPLVELNSGIPEIACILM